MKKTLFILISISLLSFSTTAQEDNKKTTKSKAKKISEVGISFSNFNQFGINYKIGNESILFRTNILAIRGENSKEEYSTFNRTIKSNGVSTRLGMEGRFPLKSNFEFRLGFDLSYQYNKSEFEEQYINISTDDMLLTTNNESNTYGANLVVGMNYVLKESFVFGLEILPFVSHTNTKSIDNTNNFIQQEEIIKTRSIDWGLNSTSALISISYRF